MNVFQGEQAMPSIHAGNSSGPLPSVTRCYAEAFFNQPFGDIRLHLDRQPAALGAEAFAQGNALHVLPERFAPKTRAGLSLLGHELAHVVQQRRGMAQRRGPDADVRLDDPVLEREADALDRNSQPSVRRGGWLRRRAKPAPPSIRLTIRGAFRCNAAPG
jgi:hypothetical protein